jgi:hypothetical protein
MKRNLSIIFTICIFISHSSCEKVVTKCCDCIEKEGESDAYNYPIIPGSEEWKKLTSHTAMVEVCQIPKKTLKNMCTFGLIETYLNYPLLFVVTAFNNTKEGMQQMFEEFNGANELLYRNDAPSKLMERYDRLNPTDLDTTWTQLEQGKFLFQFAYLEFTLAYDPILKALTKEQQSQLVHIATTTYNEKMSVSPSNWKTLTSFFLIANLLNELQYQPFLTFTEQHPIMNEFIKGYMINLFSLSNQEQEELTKILNNYLNDY